MTPEALAELHASAMSVPGPWDAASFAELLDSRHVFLIADDFGFALGRVVLDEAELLTLAVDPELQGQGNGRRLLRQFERKSFDAGGRQAFLDVAESNAKARSLYTSAGWHQTGRRKAYYNTSTGREDAILMLKALKFD